MRWLRHWFGRRNAVSARWLSDQARKGDRIEFHGVAIRWPINKVANESPWRTQRPRKRA